MKESKYYTCKKCFEEFIPRRRNIQKYCSNSCRSGAYQLRNKKKNTLVKQQDKLPDIENIKKDTINSKAMINTAGGNLAYDIIKNLLTPNLKKNASKEDILFLFNQLKRYHRISNMPNNKFGQIPHFDLHTKSIVYLRFES